MLITLVPIQISLLDVEGNTLAYMDVTDVWRPDKQHEANHVFGGDKEHPAIRYLGKM